MAPTGRSAMAPSDSHNKIVPRQKTPKSIEFVKDPFQSFKEAKKEKEGGGTGPVVVEEGKKKSRFYRELPLEKQLGIDETGHVSFLSQHMAHVNASTLSMKSEDQQSGITLHQNSTSPPTSVRVVILAGSYGRTLAKDIVKSGEYAHLVSSERGKKTSICKPLIELNDTPVMNYWMHAIKKCTRLTPPKRHVYILCNEYNKIELQAWACNKERSDGGFPMENIISNGSQGPNDWRVDVEYLEEWVRNNNIAEHLLVIYGDFVLSPQFNLQRIIEHSLARGKDTITFSREDHSEVTLPHYTRVTLDESSSAANPKILELDCNIRQSRSSSTDPLVAPVYMIRRTSLPYLTEFVQASKSGAIQTPDNDSHFGVFLKFLLTKVPIYGLEVLGLFSVRTLNDLRFTDHFLTYYSEELRMRKMEKEEPFSAAHIALGLDEMYEGGPPPRRKTLSELELEQQLHLNNIHYMTQEDRQRVTHTHITHT